MRECGGPPLRPATPGACEEPMTEPRMPEEIVDYMDANRWGAHHAAWHGARLWGFLGPEGRDFVAQHAGGQAARQEGTPGNGLDFLAMYRVMIEELRQQFSGHDAYFTGWTQVPINPLDANDPKPQNEYDDAFDPPRLEAIQILETQIEGFKDDDELGLFIQTRLRPSPTEPGRRSNDIRCGLHNYLHSRFASADSGIDMARLDENFKNQRFWRLHGWIDRRWQAFRDSKNLGPNDPVYLAAMKEHRSYMTSRIQEPHRFSLSNTSAKPTADRPIPGEFHKLFSVLNSL